MFSTKFYFRIYFPEQMSLTFELVYRTKDTEEKLQTTHVKTHFSSWRPQMMAQIAQIFSEMFVRCDKSSVKMASKSDR